MAAPVNLHAELWRAMRIARKAVSADADPLRAAVKTAIVDAALRGRISFTHAHLLIVRYGLQED